MAEFKLPFLDPIKGDAQEQVQALQAQYEAADTTRRRFEPDWYNNILYLAGNQWEQAAADVRRHRKIVAKPVSTKVKLVSNQIYPLARQAASALRDNLATLEAIAATTDKADLDAAELATDVLQSRFWEDHESKVQVNEILWTMCTGRVLRKTFWDPDADGWGTTGRVQGAGDIATLTLDPFRFHTCPWDALDTPGGPTWIIESDVRSIEEINDLWPGSDVEAEEYADSTRLIDKLLVNIVEGTTGTTADRKGAAILKRLYAKPNRKHPLGRMFVWAAGVLLQVDDLPEGEMPYAVIDWFPIPGRQYPLSFVTPLRDLQKEINTTLSQLVELKNRQLRGDIVVAGPGEITQEVDPDSGQKVLRLPPNLQWQFVQYSLNTQEAEILLNRLWDYMMQDAGIRESSVGQNPRTQVTATQLALMKDADTTGLSFFRAARDLANAAIGRQKLLVARNHYQLPRMARVVGESNVPKVRTFMGSDLRDTQDVRPRSVPILSQTQIAGMKQEAASSGMYGPYADPREMLAKVTALLNSGIPNIREEIDSLLAPLTLDELREIVGEINRTNAMSAVLAAKLQLKQLAGVLQGGGEGEQNPPKPPSEQINFRDLPLEGQRQMAAHAGIDLGAQGSAEEMALPGVPPAGM